MTGALTADSIKQRASDLGFDACGIAPATHLPELAFFEEWIARGYAGTMTFLERSAAQRADIRQALPSAQSVIVTATLYNTERPFTVASDDVDVAHVARYAWGDDYHAVIMRRLDALIAWMHQVHPGHFETAPYVDTGPVQERVFAQYAGIGWIGKNCCVIHRELGSFIFLAEILCSLPLPPDPPALDQCGSCTRCLEACPTGALVAPAVLDARRCISYLTIEHRGEIDAPLDQLIGNHVYGCDICQEVCPFNGAAPASPDPAWQPRPFWDRATIDSLEAADDRRLREALKGSAMERARVSGVRRNVQIAKRNRQTKAGA